MYHRIMGPTGAGKSSFVESFGFKDESCPKISSNGLEGCTQVVTTYTLENVYIMDEHEGELTEWPLYLIDSPGFSDTKISEVQIVNSLAGWIRTRKFRIDYILFFCPINQTRLPGTQRRVLQTFRSLTGVEGASRVGIVTTMWDGLWSQTAKDRARNNFNQLQNEAWKDYIESGSQIHKFHNTQASALSILDHAIAYVGTNTASSELFQMVVRQDIIRTSRIAPNLRYDLEGRIIQLRQQQRTIESDLAEVSAVADEEDSELLRSTLLPRLEEAKKDRKRFEHEYLSTGFQLPPDWQPPPQSSAPQGECCPYCLGPMDIDVDSTPGGCDATGCASPPSHDHVQQDPNLEAPDVVVGYYPPQTSYVPQVDTDEPASSASVTATVPISSNPQSSKVEHLQPGAEKNTRPGARGFYSILPGLKCCGKDVLKNHDS
ncbi:hypothetical protein CVT24_009752 [Panaeolus cyanescens]|uniref:G domain-containing protein n=1 Tax=Panaeolus cyanescens TaxID=181874 RepID=A0A409Y9E5_9AGAR|nr:hypothetical protein CVT24_009752 [Panaeolus cyanescens]